MSHELIDGMRYHRMKMKRDWSVAEGEIEVPASSIVDLDLEITTSKANIYLIDVTGSSDFDFLIYESSARTDETLVYEWDEADTKILDLFINSLPYESVDGSNKIFCRIVNRSGATTFKVKIKYEGVR